MKTNKYYSVPYPHDLLVVASSNVMRTGLLMFVRCILPVNLFVIEDNNTMTLQETLQGTILRSRYSHVFLVLQDYCDMQAFMRSLSEVKKSEVGRWHVFVSWNNSIGLPILCNTPNTNVIDVRQPLPILARDMAMSLSISCFVSHSLKLYVSPQKLTVQEGDVLRYLKLGLSLESVACLLGCKKKTTQEYRARAMRKLQLKNQSELIHWLPFWQPRSQSVLTAPSSTFRCHMAIG